MFILLPLLSFFSGDIALANTSFQIDQSQSSTEFLAIGKPSMLKIKGSDAKPTGILEIKGLNLAGEIKIKLDDFSTGMNLRNKHMKEKYLETQKYPESILKLDPILLSAVPISQKEIPFKGSLELHGQTKAIAGTLHDLVVSLSELKASGNFKIKTSDYNIATPSFAGATMAEEVVIEFKATAKGTP